MKAILKAELKWKGVTYAKLVDKLAAVGVKKTESNIRNKLARGKFAIILFFLFLVAISVDHLSIR